jgi:hypothetical protein
MLQILEDNIYYYKDVIQDPYNFIQYIEDLDKELSNKTYITPWKDWKASGGSDYIFGKQKFIDLSISNAELTKECMFVIDTITNAIKQSSNDYATKHENMNIGSLSPISISKYFAGKSMGSHVDNYNNDLNKTISVVLYLNDDYEGGELNFSEQGICIKPDAGSLVIFPSQKPYYHESKTIINGVKYMTPGFWEIQK